MSRIAVVGTRPPDRAREPNFDQAVADYDAIVEDVWRVLDARLQRGPFSVITGGALGVDRLGEAFARKHGLHVMVIEPDYRTWSGHEAPLVRNGVIANECDGMVAWPKRSGGGGGTSNAIAWAKRWGRDVVVRRPWA